MNNESKKISQAVYEQELIRLLHGSESDDSAVQTTLRTDERVIARVTDGIYRQPGSAIRELISNAYDADATEVTINTDAPRFSRISIQDNGHGMKPEALARLLFHIGGSSKRQESGAALGVTSATDPTRSPGGRRLIGKIGIGLFSVSQLTHTFQIITKVKGDQFRTVASVILRQYSDDSSTDDYEAGKVLVWREPASDTDAHGTTIVLTGIRPQARDTLRSREIWDAVRESEKQDLDGNDRQKLEPPEFHIGHVDASEEYLETVHNSTSALPWSPGDEPKEAFKKLVDCVWSQVGTKDPNPRLDRIFDHYLRMAWQLSLAIPLDYIEGHPFSNQLDGWAEGYLLSNSPKGTATEIRERSVPLWQAAGLKDPNEVSDRFEVSFDDLQLSHPLRFRNLPATNNAVKHPIIFVGKCEEQFAKFDRALSGGPLSFEAYLFWTPKIAPVEHAGVLIRVNGASGTLFDPTFLRYQVAETNRLRQITCEIFISEGLDSALNIDRESFNNAHPHSVYITRWLHSALRQLATTQKRLASELRSVARNNSKSAALSEIQAIATSVWRAELDDPAASPPGVEFTDEPTLPLGGGEVYTYSRANVIQGIATATATGRAQPVNPIAENKLKAITQVLASFGMLDGLSRAKQEQMLKAIFSILDTSGE